jgi:D-alanyl-D-alanine carboxypeptidase/D-alanyl-D-alanine-endopeptidase (penicillin-binding protein 4)
VVNDWLAEIGLALDDVDYYDGSGLSPMNLAKPAAIVYLLDYMYHSDNFGTYYESLAIPGSDRSVRSRMAGHPLAAKMRTKTGSIANTRTFAGYLTTRSGRLVAFSLMVNNYSAPVSLIDNWLDKVCAFVIDNY